MILLPEIDSLERTQRGLSLGFVVPESLPYFDGHFPGLPLLPGVVQIGWAVELARLHLSFTGTLSSLAGVKFTRVIQPPAAVTLLLELRAEGRELAFEYLSAAQTCSSGRVICR